MFTFLTVINRFNPQRDQIKFEQRSEGCIMASKFQGVLYLNKGGVYLRRIERIVHLTESFVHVT